MEDLSTPERINVRLANELGEDVPLWLDDCEDETDLPLSEGLLVDLAAFAARWLASIPAEVFDDRWIGVPLMGALVDARNAVRRLLDPAGRRAAKAEDAAIELLGEALCARVQGELGDGYLVTYLH